MIFLVLAVLSSVLVSLIMRISEKHIHNNISMKPSQGFMQRYAVQLKHGNRPATYRMRKNPRA